MYNKPIAAIVLAILILIALAGAIILYQILQQGGSAGKIDAFFKSAIPFVAALYFLYQAYSGVFFATTSILLEANRDTSNPNLVVIKATIERGDNWLVEIEDNDSYLISNTNNEDYADNPKNFNDWKRIGFPRRYDGNRFVLRLAPKEKTQTSFFIEDKAEGFFLTAKINYFSVGWPFSATSLSKIYVPAAKKD